jgi:uncharacterized protein (TIGR03435 family)
MRVPFAVIATVFLAVEGVPQSSPGPAFEVASVRYSERTAGNWCRFLPGGRLSASSWVKQFVQIARGVEDCEVSGGPRRLTTDRYDIEAKAPGAGASA